MRGILYHLKQFTYNLRHRQQLFLNMWTEEQCSSAVTRGSSLISFKLWVYISLHKAKSPKTGLWVFCVMLAMLKEP